MHRPQNVGFCRLTHGILLVVSQNDHVFTLVPEVSVQVARHVLDIVYASSQLASLTEVVNSDQQCFSSACAIRVLEGIASGSA